MRNPLNAILNSKKGLRLALLVAAFFFIMSAMPRFSTAHSAATVTVTNNSRWEIRHVYLSPADNDNWGPDQLNDGVIRPGESFDISVPNDQSQIKIVTEDQDGCFLYKVVETSSNSTWTITNDATPNCGGN